LKNFNILSFAEKIKSNPRTKAFFLWLVMPKGEATPRWWVSFFINPFVHKRGRHSIIRRRARLDVLPFRKFNIGKSTTIEDFTCINNGMGDVIIGDDCTIGIGSVIIAPVTIGSDVMLAQHVCLSGLNHGYEDIHTPPNKQKCTTAEIIIEDECWIGANSVVVAGVTIGKHSVVAGGSVVVKNVPPFSIVAGNPAKLIRQYNPSTQKWERPELPS